MFSLVLLSLALTHSYSAVSDSDRQAYRPTVKPDDLIGDRRAACAHDQAAERPVAKKDPFRGSVASSVDRMRPSSSSAAADQPRRLGGGGVPMPAAEAATLDNEPKAGLALLQRRTMDRPGSLWTGGRAER